MTRRRFPRAAVAAAAAVMLALTPFAKADNPGSRTTQASRDADARDVAAGGSARSARAASAGNYGIPPLVTNDAQQPYDGAVTTAGTASKLRTAIALPLTTAVGNVRLCSQLFGDAGPDFPDSCPDVHPPTTTFDTFDSPSFAYWLRADGPIWIKSPPGSRLQYGTFAPITVRTLAFGALPAEATVAITQDMGTDGLVKPLRLSYLTSLNTVPREGGKISSNRYWRGFSFPAADDARYPVLGFQIAGQVNISVLSVRLDGRRVEVGSSCRSAHPAQLLLKSPDGVYKFDAPASSLRGRPGGAQPLNIESAGDAQGVVSIPEFRGCGTGREDLDPLLTGLVSAPRNPIEVQFNRAFSACNREGRDTPCPDYPVDSTKTSARVPAAGSASPRSGIASVWPRLAPATRRLVAHRLAGLPIPQRSATLASLPTAIARAVRSAR